MLKLYKNVKVTTINLKVCIETAKENPNSVRITNFYHHIVEQDILDVSVPQES